MARLPGAGVAVSHLALPAGFPFPSANDLAETERALANVPRTHVIMIDGLAFGALPVDLVAPLPQPVLALVHHPLALESGLTATQAEFLRRSERAALQCADAVIASSPTTARTLVQQFNVPDAKVRIAAPGVTRAPRANGSDGVDGVRILAVGAVTPRKGYDGLIAAAARNADLNWRIDIAGSTDRAPDHVRALQSQIAQAGLSSRVILHGAVSDDILQRLYHEADLFVLASHYEGYGMVLAEAMVRGLPIVTTTGGAASETVPDTAALKVPPGNTCAMARALRQAIGDGDLRRRLSHGAWAAASQLPSWTDTVDTIATTVREVAKHE